MSAYMGCSSGCSEQAYSYLGDDASLLGSGISVPSFSVSPILMASGVGLLLLAFLSSEGKSHSFKKKRR